MGDLISRQALCEYALNQKDKSVTPNDIMRFPSAQPDVPDTNVGDTISRKAAIDALYHVDEYNGRSVEAIRNLPSAEPERKTGRWILCTSWLYECSECGRRPPKAEWTSGRYLSRYCPHCGARMENDL